MGALYRLVDAQEAEHQKRNADGGQGRESLTDSVSDGVTLSFPPWENFATADVETGNDTRLRKRSTMTVH